MTQPSDPRIAALADSLIDAGVYSPAMPIDDLAAVILAALPPDWCGHGAFMDTAALRAEIARLRRIEEAAQEALAQTAPDLELLRCCVCCGQFDDEGHLPRCFVPALRAALEEKP